MKIVVLDGYTENPGDLSWNSIRKFGEVEIYDRTAYEDSPLIVERIGDAEIVIVNKTPITKDTINKCQNIISQLFLIDSGCIPGDDPSFFQPFNPGRDSRGRKICFFCNHL